MSTKSSNPVLGPETGLKNTNTKVDLKRVEQERLERLKKLNPEVPKERTLIEKIVAQLQESLKGNGTTQAKRTDRVINNAITTADKALKKAERKALQKKNIERDEATSRLNKNNYGSMDGSTSDRRSGTKQPTAAQLKAKAAEKRERDLSALIMKQDAANYRERRKKEDQLAALLAREGVTAVPPKSSAKSTTTGNLRNVNVPVNPKTIETHNVDKLKSVKRPIKTSQEAKERSSVKTAKKKRDRLFGLDFLPEIDSKEGGDKVNLPFGLGSYETLPQEEDYSKNKKGGRIKYKSGGRMRKAGCKRGMGKALRGY